MPTDPHDTAYAADMTHPHVWSPHDAWGNRREQNSGAYDPSPQEERFGEEADDDYATGNWGPPPDPDLTPDPGFSEREVDTHPDPDHGREDHRVGAILRQAEQWPDRCAHYDDYDKMSNDMEAELEHENALTGDVRVMHPHETGLEYPVLARPNPKHGPKAYDVIKPLG